MTSILGRTVALMVAAGGVLVSVSPTLAQTFSTYNCRDGSEFVASFRDTRRVDLQLDGHTMTLRRRISTSGSRYVKGDITVWIKGQSVTLKRGRQTTDCSVG